MKLHCSSCHQRAELKTLNDVCILGFHFQGVKVCANCGEPVHLGTLIGPWRGKCQIPKCDHNGYMTVGGVVLCEKHFDEYEEKELSV